MRRRSYFWTLLFQSLLERRGRVILSVLTVAVGTSVIGAFALLNADIETKMSRELRTYGANFVVRPEVEGSALRDDVRRSLIESIPPEKLIGTQALVYDILNVKDDRVVTAGIDFGSIEKTTPYWQRVAGAIPPADASAVCLFGKDVAERLGFEVGKRAELKKGTKVYACTVAAIVETGGAEDGQVFLPLDEGQTLFDRRGEIDLILASIVARSEEAETLAHDLERTVPGSRAQPIHTLARSEGMILKSIRSIMVMVVFLVAVSAFTCLLISLIATVSERRQEIALMKSIGATDRQVSFHFLMEIAVTGLLGGQVGLAAGFGMASLMGITLFGTAVAFHAWLVPLVLAMALAISMLGAAIPLRTVAALQPAIVLKGE